MEPFREGHRSRGYLFPVPLLPLSLGAAGGSVGAIEDLGAALIGGEIAPIGVPPQNPQFFTMGGGFFCGLGKTI